MAQHYTAQFAPPQIALALEPYEPGTTAVYVFFIVSGLVITETIDRFYQGRPLAFAINRAVRILPIACFGIGAGALVYVLAHPLAAATSLESFGRVIALFNGNVVQMLPFVSKKMVEFEVLPVGWSLRAENLFYAVCVLAMVIAALEPVRRRPAVVLALVWGAAALFIAAFATDAVLARQSLLRFIPLFMFGAAAYHFFYRAEPAQGFCGIGRWTILLGIVGLIAVEQALQPPNHPEFHFARNRLEEVTVFVLLCAAMLVLARLKVAPRTKRIDMWFGNLSYPLYIVHCIVMILWHQLKMEPGALCLTGAIAMTLAVAVIAEVCIDRPMSRRRDAMRGQALLETVAAPVGIHGPLDKGPAQPLIPLPKAM